MDYGSPLSNTYVKLFGIEDMWGVVSYWLTGIKMVNSKYLVTTDNFNSNATGYTDEGAITKISWGYQTSAIGNTSLGFLPLKATGGSNTTYYCCQVNTDNTTSPLAFDGQADHLSHNGILLIGFIMKLTLITVLTLCTYRYYHS